MTALWFVLNNCYLWTYSKEIQPVSKVSIEEQKEIRELIDKNELRLGYDLQMAGYGGHVPTNLTGPFRKQELANKY